MSSRWVVAVLCMREVREVVALGAPLMPVIAFVPFVETETDLPDAGLHDAKMAKATSIPEVPSLPREVKRQRLAARFSR